MALNKPSQQSSTYGGLPQNKPSYANDGKTWTRSATKYMTSQWWSVDMLKVNTIDRIVIHLWPYAFNNKYYERMSISTRIHEGDDWPLCTNAFSPKNKTMTYTCNKRTKARYVKISRIVESRLDILYSSGLVFFFMKSPSLWGDLV